MKPIHPVNVPLPLPVDLFTESKPKVTRRRRSSTFTAITNWTLAVQPGSPAPLSPESKPTPKNASSFDLTSHGYTSVFVQLPYTPTTPGTPKTPTGIKRMRSFGILKRARAKSNAAADRAPPSGPLPPVPSLPHAHRRPRSGSVSPKSPSFPSKSKKPAHGKSKSFSASTLKKDKRSTATTTPPLPPSLTSELLLMQLFDGGSLESHAQRVMEKQAKAALPAGSSKSSSKTGTLGAEPLTVNAVYRDENGVMWRDEDEALEYKKLLPPSHTQPPSPSTPWVGFDSRKGSIASVLTTSSNGNSNQVDLADVITPVNVEAYGGVAMHVLNVNANGGMYSSSLPSSSAQNKRTRRRPAPLKLNSADDVRHLNVFEDSFVPIAVPVPVSASVSSLTSPSTTRAPACAPLTALSSGWDADGDVIMRERDHDHDSMTSDGRRNGVIFASPTNPLMFITKKASRMGPGLRGRAKSVSKALFGAA
ncbi:hypothetical protein D9758_007989 [Tetrapyrgos nigripes]|uniref:Uncharacterized protein n=1 Tax=Tetrapyrgos nigripes TaxID=182062 RepID=A0A8H5D0A6_9AGAR|nr:hypothetical protein D9758_007989 [Tetrapyrgos nigripes]